MAMSLTASNLRLAEGMDRIRLNLARRVPAWSLHTKLAKGALVFGISAHMRERDRPPPTILSLHFLMRKIEQQMNKAITAGVDFNWTTLKSSAAPMLLMSTCMVT
jgi:hypothetical protein